MKSLYGQRLHLGELGPPSECHERKRVKALPGEWEPVREFKWVLVDVQHEKDAVDSEGWFSTGDIATLDPYGYMQITDRSKDVIKSGGEWISSIEVENIAASHPKVISNAATHAPA